MGLPHFIIGGAARSGTHALYSWLVDHPAFDDTPRRETRFFDRNYTKGLDWYRRRFADGVIAGEVGPRYLSHPEAATRIARDVPGVRLIFVLRDPVERAYSDFWMHRARGLEQRSFVAAIEAPDGRELYVETGHYAQHLRRFFDHLDRSQIHVALFDDLAAEPVEVFRRVVSFLEADPGVVPKVVGSAVNVHVMFRSRRVRRWAELLPEGIRGLGLRALSAINTKEAARPPMEPSVAQRLREYYREHDAELVELLGIDVPWYAPRS